MNDHKETTAVLEVIKKYKEGTYNANTALLEEAFHEKAVMNGYLGPNLLMGDTKPFIDDIGGSPSMASNGDPFQGEVESIRIEGNVASVVFSETGFRGDATLVDFFHLIKADGRWSIISKLFTTI
jgi:hypothetical protein